ncbi:hypothetical protein GCM10007304_46970 [Rhodococcoides trifolii]|uniref:Uncharacterized protein n=1 Tax=Rhodococcoides trifolii TaxID=908250 RepID=A0A917G7S5_9NOCA|nr:hypothetical protein GCM10007304_46970 [Rhodococcus trifolii]
MFDNWNAHMQPLPYRVVDPPQPVTVDLGVAFARSPRSRSDGLPMRVRAEGLVLSGTVNAELHAWVRTNLGDWLALVCCTTTSGNSKGTMDLQQWVPSGSVRPVDS